MKVYSNKKKYIKNSRRIVADEYIPENYADLGYDGLDDAIRAVTELRYELQEFINSIDDAISEYTEFGGYTPTEEWFDGPDSAYDFAEKCYDLADVVRKAGNRF